MQSGSHYWEIRIDRFTDDDDIAVGIAKDGIGMGENPFESDKFLGYMCL